MDRPLRVDGNNRRSQFKRCIFTYRGKYWGINRRMDRGSRLIIPHYPYGPCLGGGATYGGERLVMLGNDLVLSGSLVKNKKFSYVAMGHIHKPQDVNQDQQPPVIYPGSIERVDFGEAKEDRFYVIAHIEKGVDTKVNWIKLEGTRPFIERRAVIESSENVTKFLKSQLPRDMSEAIVKLVVEYPREWDTLIDDAALRKYAQQAFEFHLVKKPKVAARVRIPEGQVVSSLSPLDLLEQYFDAAKVNDKDDLQKLAREIISADETSDDDQG